MASKIVPGNVDGTYPKAGQDNSSQGFRDNFSAIKSHYWIEIFEIAQKCTCMLIQKACCLSSSIARGIQLRFSTCGYAISQCKIKLGCDGSALPFGYKLKKI